MDEQWLIDGEQLFEFLSDQLVKEKGTFSQGVNKGLNIARSAIHNVDAVKPIDPETLSIVRQLREELARVTAERDAAVEQLRGYCPACKSYTENHCEGPCEDCKHEYYQYRSKNAMDNWEWRGPRKEE